jgi:uncharacterized protein YndB with AHSA1/START domain
MKADIDVTMTYPYPADRVWAALTSSQALSAWFMPNDFEPAVGHRFTFHARPFRALGFDGIVRCEVLELDPPKRMVWSWAGGNIDTTVTFTLEQTADGTRLRMRQVGFDGLGGQLNRRILSGGYPRILGQRLPAYLGEAAAGPGAAPLPAHDDEDQCAEDGRWRLGPFRRSPRQFQSR